MNRRSKAGGEQLKGRRRKAPEPKRRNAPKVATPSNSPSAGKEAEVARLGNELRQALEQQTATSEVFRIISSSLGDPQPVFEAMLKNAVRLCEAKFGNIYRWDGDALHLVATQNAPVAFAQARERSPFRPSPKTPTGRMIANKTVVHTADLRVEKAYADRDPWIVAGVELGGVRTVLMVPMLKDDELIGALSIYRQEVRPFTDKQIALVQNFAAHAVIAIENARLLNELGQSLEQEMATSQILQVISSSPGDLEKVFATILQNATRICEAKFGALYRSEGDGFRAKAMHNAPPAYEEARAGILHPPPRTSLWRAANTKRPVQIADVRLEEGYIEGDPFVVTAVALGGYRSVLNVPMLHEDELVGVITIFRQEVNPFTDKQIELVKNFAAQAVIAIENARLLNELRGRTQELTEALEQRTATSDVLGLISSSPGELSSVFDAILANALRFCEADMGHVLRLEAGALTPTAMRGGRPEYAQFLRERKPWRPAPNSAPSEAMEQKMSVQIADMRETSSFTASGQVTVAAVELGGLRTVLIVPMIADEKAIGIIVIYRTVVRSFSDKQIALVENFAKQAVIAIENARLLNELRQRTTELSEALEQQTATADVLKVISRSQFDLQLVLDNLIQTATSLCGAKRGVIFRRHGELYRAAAFYNATPELIEFVKSHPIAPGRHTITARVALERRVIHVADLQEDAEYTYALRDTEPIRTELGVPMFRGDDLVGVFILYKLKAEPFTDKQIELVTTFADQAVIAIENVRLLNELRERTDEVEKLNQHLEKRVTDQIDEIERMSRLRRFLPPQVADLIVASGSEKQLESHRREITALFCDLRGFTGFTESADAEDVMALLRAYHAAIGEIIIKYNGTLERYAGDGVMVVFNDPVPVENPALQAVLMALELRDALGALTATWSRLGHEIGFGIGIAHGFATLGTIGFEGRFDYAAIGTVSNVASRLCDEAKPGQILISPRVLMKVENAVTVEPVGEFELKGIRRPLAAYNVLAASRANGD